MRRILTICCSVIVLGISSYETAWSTSPLYAVNQAPAISIQNFRAVNVSSGELRVTVDYTYPRAVVGKVLIHAIPTEADGSFNPRTVDFDEVSVQSGTHTVTLGITKRSTGPVFKSVEVRVCISNSTGALLCRDFPLEKNWTNAAGQMCSIFGRVIGPLDGLSYPDHAGPPTRVFLRDIILETPDGKQRSALINNRSYTFSNLEAGVVYTVFPSGFQSLPARRTVECRPNSRHRADFRITRPTPQG